MAMRRASLIALGLGALFAFTSAQSAAQEKLPRHTRSRAAIATGVALGLGGVLVGAAGGLLYDHNKTGSDNVVGAVGGMTLGVAGLSMVLNSGPLVMYGMTEPKPESPPLVVAGIAATTLGLGAIGAGAMMLAFADTGTRCTPYATAPNAVCTEIRPSMAPPIALLAAGATVAVAGLVLWRVGDRPGSTAGSERTPAAFEVRVSPGLGSLRWSF